MKIFNLALRSVSGLSFAVLLFWSSFYNATAAPPVDVVLFYGQGCPHCAGMMDFLESEQEKNAAIRLYIYELYFERENIPVFQKLASAYGKDTNAVPTAFIGDKSFVGFSPAISAAILEEIEFCSIHACSSPLDFLEKSEIKKPVKAGRTEADAALNTADVIRPPSVPTGVEMMPEAGAAANTTTAPDDENSSGKNIVNTITIPAVIGAAIVDAINPCAFAVLIILITTILASGNRRRALFSGLAFSLSIFISYFLMGLGLYSAIQASGLTHSFYAVIGVLAVLIGLFNLKDYLWYGKWFVMEVPLCWRPKLKSLLHGVTSVPGAFFIGFLISLFLLPCTSGPYIVILGMLAHTTTKTYATALLVLYNLIFVLPMLIITGAIFFGITNTEQAEAWRQKKLRLLHLIAGLIILALGVVMLGSLWLGYM